MGDHVGPLTRDQVAQSDVGQPIAGLSRSAEGLTEDSQKGFVQLVGATEHDVQGIIGVFLLGSFHAGFVFALGMSAGQQVGVGRNLTDGFAVLPKKQTRICACSLISFCDFAVPRINGDS